MDTFYAARREHGTIVSLACHEPEETCFCKNFGIDAAEPGADVETWIIEDSLYWEPLTEKGEALTVSLAGLLENADAASAPDAAEKAEKAVAKEQSSIRDITEKLPLSRLNLSRFKQENTMELFDSPRWEERYKPCQACGTCPLECSTCQ